MAESSHRHTPSPPDAPARRTFLQWLMYGLGALAAAAFGIPYIGFFLAAVRKAPVKWVNLGSPSKFPVNETRLETFDNPIRQPWDGMTAHIGVYVRNLGPDDKKQERFLIFAMNCTHLGCPVTWFPQSGLFMCPCHGGVYYENGEHAAGPPPRGLYHCVWKVEDGTLWIQAPHLPTLQNTLTQGG